MNGGGRHETQVHNSIKPICWFSSYHYCYVRPKNLEKVSYMIFKQVGKEVLFCKNDCKCF